MDYAEILYSDIPDGPYQDWIRDNAYRAQCGFKLIPFEEAFPGEDQADYE